MTPSPGTIRLSADAISSRRARTLASGSGISIDRMCHCERSEAISRHLVSACSELPQRLTAPRNDVILALAGLEARAGFVDHVDAALAPDDAAILVALLQCLQRIGDL